MNNIAIILICSITGFIVGLVTNWIAVLSLFRPRKKILGIQGVLPKKRHEIAERLSQLSPFLLPDFKLKILNNLAAKSFKKSVKNKVERLNEKELEEIVLKAASKELNYIIWIGGILGFIIGLVQGLIVTAL